MHLLTLQEPVNLGKTLGLMHHNARDITGKKFGRYTVLLRTNRRVHRNLVWKCRCKCGNVRHVVGTLLRNGAVRSCGCLWVESIRKHGMTKSKTYAVWEGMIARCYNSKHPSYADYGGRGIRVCKRWRKFENFYADMKDRPVGMTIDRINNDGDYRRSNCRWATRHTQARNTRRNVWITFRGIKLVRKDWAARLGIGETSLKKRLNKWSLKKALTEPVKCTY